MKRKEQLSWWHSSVTAADLMAMLTAWWITIIVMDFVHDHINDAYRIAQVEKIVQRAIETRRDDALSDDEKNRKIDALIDQAIDHNSKMERRIKSNENAIRSLDLDYLR